MPVAVAGGKIHLQIDAGRIARQRLLDQTLVADELPPIIGVDKPEAIDAVANRNLVRRLGLTFRAHQILRGQPLIGESVLEPAIGEGKVRVLSLQVASQLGKKRARQGRIGPGHISQHQDQIRWRLLYHIDHALCPITGQVAVTSRRGNSYRDAPQILNQRQSQHERKCPELAESERLNRLIRRDEPIEAGGIDAPVDVRDQLEGNAIDARKAGGRAADQPRQLTAVRWG